MNHQFLTIYCDAGGDPNGETILWDGTTWKNFETLPKPLRRFCMAKINSTHVFLSGGSVKCIQGEYYCDWYGAESYIYSKATGFVQIANMSISRFDHACGVHDEKFVIVEGGEKTGQTEIFNLETLTWSDGPYHRSYYPWNHRMVSKDTSTYLIEKSKILKLVTAESGNVADWEWVKVANLENEDPRDVLFMKTKDCQNWNTEALGLGI